MFQPLPRPLGNCGHGGVGYLALSGNRVEVITHFIRFPNGNNAVLFFDFCYYSRRRNEYPCPGAPKGLHQGAVIKNRLNLGANLCTILQILSLKLF